MTAGPFTAMVELAAARHGVCTRTQAAEIGLTAHQIRKVKELGLITEPARGVLVVAGHPATFRQRMSILTAATPAAAGSHRASGRLFNLDDFDRADPELVIQRPGRIHATAGIDVRIHQADSLPAQDLVERDGIRTTSLARLLADLGAVVSDDAVWRALVAARRIHRVSPLWLQRTVVRLHRPGPSGTGALLRCLHRWDAEGVLPDSWFEELVHRLVDHPGVPPVVRQHVVRDSAGRFVARLDLAIPSLRLGLEAHSRGFHFGPIREAADEDRDLRLAACGWEVLYLGWYATRQPAEVAAIISTVCAERRRAAGTA